MTRVVIARRAGAPCVCGDAIAAGDPIVKASTGWVHRWCVEAAPALPSSNDPDFLTRERVRELAPCPECHAQPPDRCVGARGRERAANHRGRVIYAQRAAQTDAPVYGSRSEQPALLELRQAASAAATDPHAARRRAFALVAAERPELAARASELAGEVGPM